MKILTNARIHTLNTSQPHATTLVLYGDKIRAVGGKELLSQFDFIPVEDMQGKTILPGLVDAHFHLEQYALSRKWLNCETKSKRELLQLAAEFSHSVPEGIWVRGHGWDQNSWGEDPPTATELDAVVINKPAYLTAKSLHAACANSLALQTAGISATSADPPGGRILRDTAGKPTGVLLDNAMKLVEKIIPETSADGVADSIREALPSLWSIGLTGIHDFDGRTCFQALQILKNRGELKIRVQKSIPHKMLPQAIETGLRSGFGDAFLRIGPVKYFADGALGSHTAAMLEPFVDDQQNRGILIMDASQVFEQGRLATQNGICLAVHAIGDRAVHEVLEGMLRLRDFEHKNRLPALRHRMEHVQILSPGDCSQLAEGNIIASMQPVHAVSDMVMADKSLGKRTEYSYAWSTLLNTGARLVFGSDAPVENPNPFMGLHAAVTRRRLDGTPGPEGWHPEQRLNLQEAIEGFTLGPAYASGMENALGCLGPGYLADLIVLEHDPFEGDPDDLPGMLPLATMVGGEWVWEAAR